MRFNTKRDNIIRNNIELHPYNLQLAFRKAAQEIGICLPSQVQYRYYSHIRYVSPDLFSISSAKFSGSNSKNYSVESKTVKLQNKDSITFQYIIPFKQ